MEHGFHLVSGASSVTCLGVTTKSYHYARALLLAPPCQSKADVKLPWYRDRASWGFDRAWGDSCGPEELELEATSQREEMEGLANQRALNLDFFIICVPSQSAESRQTRMFPLLHCLIRGTQNSAW